MILGVSFRGSISPRSPTLKDVVDRLPDRKFILNRRSSTWSRRNNRSRLSINVTLLESLAQAAPNVPDYHDALAFALNYACDAHRAMNDLRQAIAAGYRSSAMYRHEPALAPLHGRDDFQLLLLDLAMPADVFAVAPSAP